MQWNIVLLGPTGSGKTTAIGTISDREPLETEAGDALPGDNTTVPMAMGVVELGDGDALRLYGIPGRHRFDFLPDLFLDSAWAAIVLIDHRSPGRLDDLAHYLRTVRARRPEADFPMVVAVTHSEGDPNRDLDLYRRSLAGESVPVLWCDPRNRSDVSAVMIVATALLESFHRHPPVLYQRLMARSAREA